MQPSLFTVRPPVDDARLSALVADLDGAGWRTAGQLRARGWHDRELRALASASEGRIVSGQAGYALIEDVTVEEANHAAAWLESQAKAMLARAQAIRRAMHRRPAA